MADNTTTTSSSTKTDPEGGKVSVKLAHPHEDHKPGDTVKVTEIEAKKLRRAGIAEPED